MPHLFLLSYHKHLNPRAYYIVKDMECLTHRITDHTGLHGDEKSQETF